MSVKDRRSQKGWSQEHLAQLSGLSLRTIQRIERGQTPSLDSLNGLAAVFDIDVSILREEMPKMDTAQTMKQTAMSANIQTPSNSHERAEQKEAIAYAQNKMAFRMNAYTYLIVMPILFSVNLILSPGTLWVVWVAVAWGASFVLHALAMKMLFGMYGVAWEKQEAEKHLKQKG